MLALLSIRFPNWNNSHPILGAMDFLFLHASYAIIATRTTAAALSIPMSARVDRWYAELFSICRVLLSISRLSKSIMVATRNPRESENPIRLQKNGHELNCETVKLVKATQTS